MTREEVYEKLTGIFRDVFNDDALLISDRTTAADIEDWDSLEQINLVVAVEKKFDIKFHIEEVSMFRNVGEMVDIIMKRIV
jgi:acyl carrier protein